MRPLIALAEQQKPPMCKRLADFLEANVNRWIDGDVLRAYGGKYAYRTRISELRLHHGMNITNRLRTLRTEAGQRFTVSEYRYTRGIS